MIPLSVQNSGNNVFRTLKTNAIPVLKATSVSIFALPCLACFQAFTKKLLPKMKRTGIAKTIEIHFPGSQSIKNIPRINIGRVRIAAPIVLFLTSS